tara:strand:+ start:118 stop:363 length:246 start_codon:yes stop_codon:yes gene_type:complete
MNIDIHAHKSRENVDQYHRPVVLKATRRKHKTFDCFALHGTDHRGNEFEIRFFMDDGQQFEMETILSSDHPDHPDNQLKDA